MNQQQKEAYYLAIRETGMEATSAAHAGVSLRAVYKEYEIDPEFHDLCMDARELVVDRYEAEAVRRAVKGTEKGIFYQGERTDEETVYSDSLLAKILTGRRPEVYGDKREITGAKGGAINVIIREFDAPAAEDPHDFL